MKDNQRNFCCISLRGKRIQTQLRFVDHLVNHLFPPKKGEVLPKQIVPSFGLTLQLETLEGGGGMTLWCGMLRHMSCLYLDLSPSPGCFIPSAVPALAAAAVIFWRLGQWGEGSLPNCLFLTVWHSSFQINQLILAKTKPR